MFIPLTKKALYKSGIQRRLSLRRLRYINRLVGFRLLEPQPQRLKALDVGCANGKDFVTLIGENSHLDIVGVDIKDYGLRQKNFEMVVADAEKIDFPDRHFDITVSIGVLEHIQPIEKLCRMAAEINRVSKEYVIVVPCISTLVEPHVSSLLWQLRSVSNKRIHPQLNYFSDDAWLKFGGFSAACSARFSFIPGLVRNLVIYNTSNGRHGFE